MIEVRRYSAEYQQEWDTFVAQSINSSFLFYRDYMEYHSDRFEDFSLMVYAKNKLISLVPANLSTAGLISHQGLTFGALLLGHKYHYTHVLEMLNAILLFLKQDNIPSFKLKLQPYFYQQNLAQELSLVLFRNRIAFTTSLGTALYTKKFQFPKRCVRSNKLRLYEKIFSEDLALFWKILEENLLERHEAKPVHSLAEITQLKTRFPDNIQLLCLQNKENHRIEAGALLYLNSNNVKVQYFASTEEGRKNRVSDVLYYTIIATYKDRYDFIDFGTCEKEAHQANIALLETKEKFGAHAFPIHTFTISTTLSLQA